VVGTISSDSPIIIFTIILVFISVIVINIMTRKINYMEV
jgi:uncharacterized membrane-anchored protein YitT (DUF2179 family)